MLEKLQNYNGKNVNEIINELALIPKQQEQLWSTIFLEHFNKVCKYEKEKEKEKQKEAGQKENPERPSYAIAKNLVFTKTLEPLVNYMIKRKKAIDKFDSLRPKSPKNHQKAITIKIVRELARAAAEIRKENKDSHRTKSSDKLGQVFAS